MNGGYCVAVRRLGGRVAYIAPRSITPKRSHALVGTREWAEELRDAINDFSLTYTARAVPFGGTITTKGGNIR